MMYASLTHFAAPPQASATLKAKQGDSMFNGSTANGSGIGTSAGANHLDQQRARMR